MVTRMKHGVITPARRAGGAPARVVNVRSKRSAGNSRIRLDKLLRSTNPKILIKRRLGGIGDVLMTTPLLKAIKELIPHCTLTYATDVHYSQGALADIIRHNPYVDELISNAQVVERDYDYSVDVTATGLQREKSGTVPPNRIDMFAEEVGIDVSGDPVPTYVLTNEETKWGMNYIKELGISPKATVIGVQARSNDARRTWPLASVRELCELLRDQEGIEVLLFDWGNTVKKWKDLEGVHLIADETMNHTASIVNQCDVIVCPDSAMLHLAGALNKKTVTIFGPIPPESRINYYPNATVVMKQMLCHPCWYSPRCARNTGQRLECLTGVSALEVKDAVMRKINEPLQVQKAITYGKDLTSKGQDPVILIKRSTSGLGDLLMTTPSIAALKAKYPGKKVHVACKRELWPVLDNNPNVDKLVDVSDNFNYKRYFMVIDVSSPCARYESTRVSSGKPVQKSRVEIFAEAMGVRETIRSLVPEYYASEDDKSWAADFLKKACKTNKPKVAIGLRSAETYRDWPEDKFQALFNGLSDNFEVIVLDQSREHSYKGVVDACGFSLKKALAVLSQCDGLITVDSGLLHFGAAMEIPTLALFGPIDYKPRCKGYKNVTVVTANYDCSPCWRNSKIPCKKTKFIKGYSKCMKAIKAEHIIKITNDKMKKVRK